jgi:sulfatase maturation enzyme AslB (radical SAM superfamily)
MQSNCPPGSTYRLCGQATIASAFASHPHFPAAALFTKRSRIPTTKGRSHMLNILYQGKHLKHFTVSGDMQNTTSFSINLFNHFDEKILSINVHYDKQIIRLAAKPAQEDPDVYEFSVFPVSRKPALEISCVPEGIHIANTLGQTLYFPFRLRYNSITAITASHDALTLAAGSGTLPAIWSCQHISSGLALLGHDVSFCCHTQKASPGLPIRQDIQVCQDELDFQAVIASRKAYLKTINGPELESSPCRDCPMLQKRVWPSISTRIDRITLNHFTKCNCKCIYCYTQKNDFKHIVPSVRFSRLLESLHRQDAFFPICTILWGGGEVTILDDFEVAFHKIARLGMRQHINTNAMRYSQAIHDGVRWKDTTVCISLDSGCRETYRRVKGVDAFDAVVETLSRYSPANIHAGGHQLSLKYILFDPNANKADIDRFMDLCLLFSIRRVILSACEGHYDQYLFSNPEAILEQAHYFRQKALSQGMHCTIQGFSPEELAVIIDS